LAEVRHLAAEAEIRAAEAERKVADRHFSQSQIDRIHKSLARWSGKDIRLPISAVNGDDETNVYAKELLSVLGIIPEWSIQLDEMSTNNGMSGVIVEVLPEATGSDRLLADDLVKALNDSGVQARGPEPHPRRGIEILRWR